MSLLMKNRYEYVPGMSLMAEAQFRRDVAWIETEPLSEADEKRLIEKMICARRDPSNQWRARIALQARDDLVEAYQPVVFRIAQKACRHISGLELMDAVSEANIGLLNVIEDYVTKSCNRPFRFCFKAIAIKEMSHEIWRARYIRGGLFPVPHYQASLLSRLRRASDQFLQAHGYEPAAYDLAVLLNMSEQEVYELQEISRRRSARSLQNLISEEEDASDRLDDSSCFASPSVRETSRTTPLKQALRHVIEHDLAPKQRQVIQFLYGFSDAVGSGASPEIVAEALGLKSKHLAMYEGNAKQRLRRVLVTLFDEQGNGISSIEATYSTKEVAALFGVTCKTIRDRAAAGLLPVKRLPNTTGSRVEKFTYPKQAIDAIVQGLQSDELTA